MQRTVNRFGFKIESTSKLRELSAIEVIEQEVAACWGRQSLATSMPFVLTEK
jgi:hypothetical protein